MMFQIKKAIRYSLIATLIIGGVGESYGQEQVDEAKQEIKEKKTGSVKKAEKRFDQYAFVDARDLYLRIADKGNKSPEVLKKLGDSYYFNGEYRDAVIWYGQLVNTGGDQVTPEYYFRYAQSLKSVQRYEEADQIMSAFETANGNDKRGQMFVKERDYLAEIERQSGRYGIKPININSGLQDFSPSFYGERLVFSSNRENSTGTLIHDWNDQPFLDLYIVDNPESDNPIINKLEGDVNTKYHESSTVFNDLGDVMYFTRNNYTDRKLKRDEEGTNKLKLYKSFRESGQWSIAEELPFNSNEYSVAHPALSPDGKTLYFASDMPGTKGLSDLWRVSINADGTYGNPENLGETINTEGRETFPFISSDGRLFFATDGHVGLGGLDVFVAQIDDNGTIGDAYNAGKPVNSSYDDFGLILNNDKGVGYFSSNRATGLGNDDIYGFTRDKKLLTNCGQVITGITRDVKTDEILPMARVQLRDQQNNVVTQTTSDVQGNYSFDGINCNDVYVVRAEKENYDPAEAIITTDGEPGRSLKRDLYLKPPVAVNVGDDLNELLGLKPIYFDLDKSFIRSDAERELIKVIAFMEQFPNSKIDVRSHTDSRADDAYNIALSQRRNTATIDYIVNVGGISRSRLTGRGYGETQLTNRCSNGVACSEGEHQLNRRSEFIILAK